jgi:hypothetical protein
MNVIGMTPVAGVRDIADRERVAQPPGLHCAASAFSRSDLGDLGSVIWHAKPHGTLYGLQSFGTTMVVPAGGWLISAQLIGSG